MRAKLFQVGLLVLGLAWGAVCCAPRHTERGTAVYIASAEKVHRENDGFDIRKPVQWPPPAVDFDPSLDKTKKELTLIRCTWCHECGFQEAWDIDNVGKPEWHPRYRGEAWKAPVLRMRNMEGSMLNEQVADRIYTYLRDESLGKYSEAEDPRNAVVRKVDTLPKDVQIKTP